jgi:hypothetical protein
VFFKCTTVVALVLVRVVYYVCHMGDAATAEVVVVIVVIVVMMPCCGLLWTGKVLFLLEHQTKVFSREPLYDF